MQTFLPYADFQRSVECLDKKRAWKQVVEARQMINILTREENGENPGYRNHTAVRAWKGYKNGLIAYYNCFLSYCKSFHKIKAVICQPMEESPFTLPPWFGYEPLHSSHRGRLLEKKYDFYKQYGWSEEPSLNCIWPVDMYNQLIPEIRAYWQKNELKY